jgi:hypothetical protein
MWPHLFSFVALRYSNALPIVIYDLLYFLFSIYLFFFDVSAFRYFDIPTFRRLDAETGGALSAARRLTVSSAGQ